MGGGRRGLIFGRDLIYRHGRTMLVTAALVFMLGVAGLASTPLTYVAQTLVYFEPSASRDTPAPDTMSQLQGEIGRLRSETVMRTAARALGLIGAEAPASVDEQVRLAELRKALSIDRYGETYLIAISARARDPQRAADLANQLATTYVKMKGRERSAQLLDGLLSPVRLVAAEANASDITAQPQTFGSIGPGEPTAGSRITEAAQPPRSPVFPDPVAALLVIVGAALLAAIGSGFFKEWLRDSFGDEDEVREILKVRQVCSLPCQKPRRLLDGDAELSCADSLIETPLSSYSEAIRRLRIGTERTLSRAGAVRQAQAQGVVIMVTSPGKGEGKTTLGLALGRAYAQAGRKTLLIDANMRAPGLHTLLGREPATGLAEYLSSLPGPEAQLRLVSGDEDTSLCFMMGVPLGNQPSEPLLTSPAFADLLAVTRKHFDIVILDTPAIEEAVDALCVASLADAVVLVLHWARTGRRPAIAAARALRDFLSPNAEIVVVLNRRAGRRHRMPGPQEASLRPAASPRQ